MITLKRESAYGDSLRNYKIKIDGNIVGEIADGQTVDLDVTPGEHTLWLRIDYGGSKKISFTVPDTKKTIHFRCRSKMVGARAWLAIFYGIFLPHRYIELELLDKEYGN